MQCEICGSYCNQTLELFGSYYAILCNNCRNEFSEALMQQEFYTGDHIDNTAYRRFLEAKVQAKFIFDYSEVRDTVKEDFRIKRLGFEFAKQWMKEKASGRGTKGEALSDLQDEGSRP